MGEDVRLHRYICSVCGEAFYLESELTSPEEQVCDKCFDNDYYNPLTCEDMLDDRGS